MKTKLTRQQLALIAVLLLAFALAKIGLIWWYLQHKATPDTPPEPVAVACAQPTQGCTLPDGSVLTFTQAPQGAKPFDLTLSKQPGDAPALEFAMRDMDMGFNRYRLADGGPQWQARVTLPVCVTGSHDWQLLVIHADRRYRIDFTTR